MSWKDILKAQGIEPVIEFIRNEMIPKMGKGMSFTEKGTLTDNVSQTAMKLLREGESGLYSQIDDEEDGIEVDLYIDDGFVLRIHFERNPNDLDNEEYSFEYGNQYEYRDKDPKIVAGLIDKFLKLIGRSDMEHGMNLDDLKLIIYENLED